MYCVNYDVDMKKLNTGSHPIQTEDFVQLQKLLGKLQLQTLNETTINKNNNIVFGCVTI